MDKIINYYRLVGVKKEPLSAIPNMLSEGTVEILFTRKHVDLYFVESDIGGKPFYRVREKVVGADDINDVNDVNVEKYLGGSTAKQVHKWVLVLG